VEINPDKGANEKALEKKYNVTGYPSFLVSIPSLGSQNEKVYPFRKGADWTNDEFIQTIRKKISYIYNKKGHSCYQRKDYEEAVKYYEKAISIDPEDAYAYFGKGIVHHTVAYRDRDTSLLVEAETDYLNALERDPNHADSKRELERLRKTMKKMGIR
jgi:tetratricopeptide (TPR) repeat protein